MATVITFLTLSFGGLNGRSEGELKEVSSITKLRKSRLIVGISRFIIDTLAYGSRILIGEDPSDKT